MAKPRVFVSSTYYDLKYARERLERFIESYNMEPVLFESDEIYFQSNQAIDISCYQEVHNCHIMLLIVGGRYGSLASDPNNSNAQQEKDKYDAGHVSITQKEYETAQKCKIPTLIFIDRNVYADYKTYKKNKETIPEDFIFAHVDDRRIFNFISKLEQGAIKTFDKIEDIEHYFSNQISGMLYEHLTTRQSQIKEQQIKSAVDEIKIVSQSMQEMINLIGENVLKSEKSKYDELINQQKKDLIDFFVNNLKQVIIGYFHKQTLTNDMLHEICDTIKDSLFNKQSIYKLKKAQDRYAILNILNEISDCCAEKLKEQYPQLKISIFLHDIGDPLIKIADIITTDRDLDKYFNSKLYDILRAQRI